MRRGAGVGTAARSQRIYGRLWWLWWQRVAFLCDARSGNSFLIKRRLLLQHTHCASLWWLCQFDWSAQLTEKHVYLIYVRHPQSVYKPIKQLARSLSLALIKSNPFCRDQQQQQYVTYVRAISESAPWSTKSKHFERNNIINHHHYGNNMYLPLSWDPMWGFVSTEKSKKAAGQDKLAAYGHFTKTKARSLIPQITGQLH